MSKISEKAYNNKLDYINEYTKNNYEKATILFKKGQKDHYKEIAAQNKISLSALIINALDYYILHYLGNSTGQNKDNSPE